MDSYDSDSEPEAAFVFRRNSTVSLNSEPCSKIESNNLKSFLSVPGKNNEIKLPFGTPIVCGIHRVLKSSNFY